MSTFFSRYIWRPVSRTRRSCASSGYHTEVPVKKCNMLTTLPAQIELCRLNDIEDFFNFNNENIDCNYWKLVNLSKRILVDMSLTSVHHGHIRLLKKAADLGHVVVALTSDEEIQKTKGFLPTLCYEHRKEIALAIRYVDEVIMSKWLIDEHFLDTHKIDFLVHGSDNQNPVPKNRLILFSRTEGISSEVLRNSAG